MRKVYIILNIVFIIATLIIAMCFFETSELWIKGLASAGFVLVGVINGCYCHVKRGRIQKFPILIITGLLFSMCADVVLNLHFVSGVFLFAAAHILYFVAYCSLLKLTKSDFIPMGFVTLATVMFILLAPIWKFSVPFMKYVCIIYAIMISCMLGKAVSNFFRKRNATVLILATGSGMFYFSDLMLALNMFTDVDIFKSMTSLMTYYVAQCMIAAAVLLYGDSMKITKEENDYEYSIGQK